MLSGGHFQTGSHTVCGRTDWMIALVLRAHQVTYQARLPHHHPPHRLAGRIWKESMRKQRTQNAANQPMMIWRKPKQRVWPIKSALASLSRATIAKENIAPTFPRMLSGGHFQTGSHTVCGRTDWMIALVLRVHQARHPVTYQ